MILIIALIFTAIGFTLACNGDDEADHFCFECKEAHEDCECNGMFI